MPRKNSNRVANVKKRARRPKGRPPERAWAQTLAQMKAAAAAAARRKSLRTRGGETFVRLRNGGFSNSCGPICLLQHAMSDSLPIATIERATNGEIASEVRGALRYIRDITVDTSHGHTLSVLDPDEEREVHGFEDLVDSAERDILSKPMWDKIMRCPYGYFDGRAMMIGADALGLDGLLIVRVDSAGFLVAMDGMTTPVAEAKHLSHCPLVLVGSRKVSLSLNATPTRPILKARFKIAKACLYGGLVTTHSGRRPSSQKVSTNVSVVASI